MNTVTLVGRLTSDPEVVEFDENQYRTVINLAVSRDYRNSDGIYETDFIPCILWNGIAEATRDYCHKGDVVGVRGKLLNVDNKLIVLADKVTFISSYRKEEK